MRGGDRPSASLLLFSLGLVLLYFTSGELKSICPCQLVDTGCSSLGPSFINLLLLAFCCLSITMRLLRSTRNSVRLKWAWCFAGSTVGLVEGQVLEIFNTSLLLTLYAFEIFNSQMNNNLVVVGSAVCVATTCRKPGASPSRRRRTRSWRRTWTTRAPR